MAISQELRQEIEEHIPQLQGWCTIEKGCRLAELIIDNKLERVIEIGIFGGRSIIPMALAMREQKCGCVHGLDPWDKEHALECERDQAQIEWWQKLNIDDIREGFERHVIHHRLFEWLHWSRFGSVEMAHFWPNDWADMIHLDGDHAEETSCRDVKLWMPKVRPGGYFVFDDVNWPSQKKAGEILAQEFQFIEKHETNDGQSWALYQKPTHYLCTP